MRTLAFTLLAALTATSAHAQAWADQKSPPQFAAEYAASKGLCRKLGDREGPASDRPSRAQSKALKGCSAEALYYGEGRKPDYAQARACAFVEADGADDEVFGGSTILMQLYANGLGVKRDYDVAIGYACRIEGAPAEIDGRVNHLAALKAKPGGARFDYCDDITSGLAGGYCAARGAEKAKDKRIARVRALEAALPSAAKPAFLRLRKASETFVEAHGGGEVDMSGTARAAMEIEEEEATRDRFLGHVSQLLNGRWPKASALEAKAADGRLNAAYRKALVFLATKDNVSTTKPDDVKTAQRAWLAYRDAFVRFARAAKPEVTPDAITERLTGERTTELEQLSQ